MTVEVASWVKSLRNRNRFPKEEENLPQGHGFWKPARVPGLQAWSTNFGLPTT